MKNLSIILTTFIFLTLSAIGVNAQTATPSPTPEDDEPEFIVPARPTVSNPAEFQKPGVLQLEFGYNGYYRSSDFKSQHDAPLALRFAVNRRILVELDTDSPFSVKDRNNFRQTGAGDTQLGIQAVLQPENKNRPGIALAYYIKLPTASKEKNLGTGRVDHNFIGLFSKTIDKTTIDFNAIYLLAGRTSDNGHASSGQAAFAVTQAITKKFGIQGEVSGLSRNDEQNGAMFALGVVTYQIGKRVSLDTGARFSLTKDAPRFGLVTGITVGLANLYKKRH